MRAAAPQARCWPSMWASSSLFLYGPFIVLGILSLPDRAGRRAAIPDHRMVDLLVPAPLRPGAAVARRAAADRRRR